MSGVFSQNKSSPEKKQLQVLIAIISIFFLILVIRLFYFQVISGDKFRAHSERNRIRPVVLEASRGLILDRNGLILADNKPSYTVAAVPFETSDRTLENLGNLTEIDVESIKARISRSSRNPFNPTPLTRDVSFKVASQVEEHLIDLPGVIIQVSPSRTYNNGDLAAHALGYVSEINRQELSRLKTKGYRAGDMIGKAGVEKSFEHYLRGKSGFEFMEVNARGEELGLISGIPSIPPQAGNNIYLTLDHRIQTIAEQAMPDSLAGALIALEPSTGAVITMVSQPGYNPNIFSSEILDNTWDKLLENPLKPLLNRISNGQYPPASTMKIITGAAALEEGLVSTETILQTCIGGYRFGDRWAGCWDFGHGALAFQEAMAHSCDVYYYQVGNLLGLDAWGKYARGFGIGEATGFDAGPEYAGLLPNFAFYSSENDRQWTAGKMLNLAIGQGEHLVTPLQMAVVIAAVANGGILYNPYIFSQAVSPRGEIIESTKSRVKSRLPISAETLDQIQEAMVAVVNVGTGKRASLPYAQVGGKTGTAENSTELNHSWFIGYAPISFPRIAIAAILENSPSGSVVPVVQKVMDAYLNPIPLNQKGTGFKETQIADQE